MKKTILGSIVAMALLSVAAMAQTTPQAPASWISFQQQENAKRAAFFQQMKADRDAFVNANPDVQTYLAELKTAQKARFAAWQASHPRRTNGTPL